MPVTRTKRAEWTYESRRVGARLSSQVRCQFPERVDDPRNVRGLREFVHGAHVIVGWRDDLEDEPCPGALPLDPLHGAEESAASDADTLTDLGLPVGRQIVHRTPP